jgi:hypothetical protein
MYTALHFEKYATVRWACYPKHKSFDPKAIVLLLGLSISSHQFSRL